MRQQISGVPLENWKPPQRKKRKVDSWMVPVSTSVRSLATCCRTTDVKETIIVRFPSKMTKPIKLWVRTTVGSVSLHQTQLRFLKKKIFTPHHGPLVCAKIPTRKDVRLFQGCLGLWDFSKPTLWPELLDGVVNASVISWDHWNVQAA